MFAAVVVRVVGLSLVVIMGLAADAYADPVAPIISHRQAVLRSFTLPAVRHETFAPLETRGAKLAALMPQRLASAPKCRRGRRALLSALIGATGAVPIAVIAHERWENEAANGAGAAATAVALGAALGAFVGLATCG